MTPPTPAAVRFCMCNWGSERRPKPEEHGAYMEEPRTSSEILADHIRCITAEMRAVAPPTVARSMEDAAIAQVLNRFADRLDGREP